MLVIPASYFARDRVVGGGERYALEYARALAELVPVTLGLFDLQPSRQTDGRLEIRVFSTRHLDQRRGFPISAASSKALRDYDVLHIMVFPTPLADWLLLAGRWRRQTIVLTDVGGGGPCWSTYLQKISPRCNLNRLACGLALLSRHASLFFTNWKQPRTILYGGVNLAQFSPVANQPQGYALYAGRLLPHKGVLPLIQALAPETPLHVVGRPYDDAYVTKLRQAAQGKNVEFIFDANDRELARQYAGANVVLQPSLPSENPGDDKSELLGLVTLEAMSCGKPVIVTRTASLPELVLDGKTGWIVPPNDPAMLRHRVEQFLQDPALSVEMGVAARQHVEKNFTWDKVAARGLDFYHQLRAPKPLNHA